ncbi:unnamed protein product [Rotaria sp. Silwood2]|nr:unnamed protein product [Rotaria sp. Silwood2]
MSIVESSSNEQISSSYNRTRSVQYPNEYESASHTLKRNLKEIPDFDISIDQHQSKSNDSSNRFRREPPRQTCPPFRILINIQQQN